MMDVPNPKGRKCPINFFESQLSFFVFFFFVLMSFMEEKKSRCTNKLPGSLNYSCYVDKGKTFTESMDAESLYFFTSHSVKVTNWLYSKRQGNSSAKALYRLERKTRKEHIQIPKEISNFKASWKSNSQSVFCFRILRSETGVIYLFIHFCYFFTHCYHQVMDGIFGMGIKTKVNHS